MRTVYLDHAATTPMDDRVLDSMLVYLRSEYGNASSVHAYGRKARFAVEESREQIASILNAEPSEILFTSGGSESNNTVLKSFFRDGKGHLVTTAIEHEAVLNPARNLMNRGVRVTILERLPDNIQTVIESDTRLVSVMHVNNETGARSPIVELAGSCRVRGVSFHTDAVQSAGWYELDVKKLDVDLMTISAHKLYGPKGIGVLYVRNGVEIEPLIEGGSQERRRRAGTENVSAIVGMATALKLAHAHRSDRYAAVEHLRNRLFKNLCTTLEGLFVVNTPSDREHAAPHILNISFPPYEGRPLDGEMLLLNLDIEGICVSAGSACTSGAIEPSHVLLAMGLDRHTAAASVRFSLGKDNTEEEIDYASEALERVVKRMLRR